MWTERMQVVRSLWLRDCHVSGERAAEGEHEFGRPPIPPTTGGEETSLRSPAAQRMKGGARKSPRLEMKAKEALEKLSELKDTSSEEEFGDADFGDKNIGGLRKEIYSVTDDIIAKLEEDKKILETKRKMQEMLLDSDDEEEQDEDSE